MPPETLEKPTMDSLTIGQTAFDILKVHHPSWTVDELLLHPKESQDLCRRTNRRLSTKRPADAILRALLNGRKQGRWK